LKRILVDAMVLYGGLIQGNNGILKNIKSRWIFLLLSAKKVLSEYKALVLKVH
jgi:hypothetical protein